MDNSLLVPRAPEESESEALIDFLNQNLRPQQAWSVRDEFPSLFNKKKLIYSRIITQGAEILSHAAIRPLIVRTPVAVFKVGAIGSVVTSSHHRHQGLSTRVLTSCLNEATTMKCDFAILWSNLFDFYRKMGFELAGYEMCLVFEQPLPPEKTKSLPQDYLFRKGQDVAPEALLKLYQNHSVIAIRAIEDVRRFLKIPNSQVFTAWDRSGNLKAYTVEGKGLDFQDHIHEWAGDVESLLALFNHIRMQQTNPLYVICPIHATSLFRRAQQFGIQSYLGNLGMIKIIDPVGLFAKITRIAYSLGMSQFSLEYRPDGNYLSYGNQRYKFGSEGELVQLIFGPKKIEDLRFFDHSAEEALSRVLPISFWIWGWDSI